MIGLLIREVRIAHYLTRWIDPVAWLKLPPSVPRSCIPAPAVHRNACVLWSWPSTDGANKASDKNATMARVFFISGSPKESSLTSREFDRSYLWQEPCDSANEFAYTSLAAGIHRSLTTPGLVALTGARRNHARYTTSALFVWEAVGQLGNIAAVINPRGASQSETLEWDRGENFENRLLGPTISARYGRDGHGSPHSLLIVMQAANCDKVH